MTTLENLYYGNIHPCERDIKRGTKLERLVKAICKHEDELTATLTDRQKELFEKFKDCQSELAGMTERDAFKDGFILATRMMMEVMEGMRRMEEM